MYGSKIADEIIREMHRDKYYKNKKRAKCVVSKKKQCTVCRYQKICEDVEVRKWNIKIYSTLKELVP